MTKPKPKTKKEKVVKTTEKAKIVKSKPKPKPKSKKKSKVVEEKIPFSVMSHVFVPKHEIVSESEIPSIMKKYHINKRTQFPHILADDAVIKEIEAKVGNVIRIYRKEPTGDCLYYRVVV